MFRTRRRKAQEAAEAQYRAAVEAQRRDDAETAAREDLERRRAEVRRQHQARFDTIGLPRQDA